MHDNALREAMGAGAVWKCLPGEGRDAEGRPAGIFCTVGPQAAGRGAKTGSPRIARKAVEKLGGGGAAGPHFFG